MRSKVTVIGAGFVGSTLGQRVAERDYADVVLMDVVPDMPQGKALDILEAGPVLGYDSLVIGTNGYDETANSDIVVVTSGIARKPGMSRDDLIRTNQGIVTQVVQEVAKHSPNAILICVTNPLDAMVQLAYKVSGFPKQRVLGMAGVLDTARFRTFIAQELNVSVRDVQAFVLGGHGDTMVPLARLSTVAGVPLPELIPAERLQQIVERTANGGAEIVNLLKQGSAYYAPSASVLQMIDSILLDKKMIMPCSVYLEGEYGINGLFVGVPAKLGAKGVEEVIQLDLTEGERAALQKSGCEVAASLTQLGVQVTAVFPGRAPLDRVVGGQVGALIAAIHRANGVELLAGDQVAAFEGAERLEAIVTATGHRVPCDFAVAGIGVEPEIPAVAGSSIAEDNGIGVDELCRTSAADVYAAGDVANHLHPLFGRIRVEHYNNAEKQGAAAARSMLGSTARYDYVHSFWSDQYEHTIEYVGHVTKWDEFVVRGSVEEGKLVGFYLVDGVVRAAIGLDRGGDPELDRDSEMAASARLVAARARPARGVLADEHADLWSLA